MYISQSVRREGSPHVSINHDALDLTTQPPSHMRHGSPWPQPWPCQSPTWDPPTLTPPQTLDMGFPSLLVAITADFFELVHLKTPISTGTDIWWLGHQSTNGWQASCIHPTGILSCLKMLLVTELQSLAFLWHCLKLAEKHFYAKGIQCGERFDNVNWLCFSF